MNPLKKLAGQTAIYGLSSIIARFLNYLLVPLHTSKAVFSPDQYGIITEMYSYVAFLVILLTYGMETAYFRYSTQEGYDKKKVYTTVIYSLFTSTIIFITACSFFSVPIAEWLKYPNNNEFVIWFSIIVGLDAISSIPMARLRAENKAMKFAFVNIVNILVNIGLNLFFLAYCMPLHKSGQTNFLIETFYNPELGVSYVFISNLIASIVKFLLLSPYMLKSRYGFDSKLLKTMLIYATPLLIAGLAGMVNEAIDKIMLKRMLFDIKGEKATMTILGIYGANYKIAMIISLFIQAFRYAAEPFFFSHEKEKNSKETYAKVMTYFVIICSFIFLGVMLYIDVIKHFVPNSAYWVGLRVVPILLMANICLGIYYNQSVWYKLTNKTLYGAYLAVFGAIITLVLNYIWIPQFTYMGSAWATLLCYASMMIASYFLGNKYYSIPYDIKRILFYLLLAVGLYLFSSWLELQSNLLKYLLHTGFMLFFVVVVYILEQLKTIKNE